MSARLSALPYEGEGAAPRKSESAPSLLSFAPAGARERQLAAIVVGISAAIFLAALPVAKEPLAPVVAFIPAYQSALVVNDVITAILLFGQFSIVRSRSLLILASAYLFTACMAVIHALSFPGLFSPTGLLGAGPQSTAWLYMFWHAGFPLLAIAYALEKGRRQALAIPPVLAIACAVVVVVAAAGAAGALATAGQTLLPAIMQGNRYTPAMIAVVSSVWLLSAAALVVLWRARPHSVLDVWLMVVLFAWIFDIGLSAVFNQGRYDVGFYAGRIYGLLAASFVLMVLLLENTSLYARLARADARHVERLRILHEIDRAVVADQSIENIAGAAIESLRKLLGVPRASVNRFDLAAGQVEWIAAAGRRRIHVGPGVRYSIALMGDVKALARDEPQVVDVHALPPGPEREALLASEVHVYMVVPMIAGGELFGAISFGGARAVFSEEQVRIAREVGTQLAIALRQAALLQSEKAHAAQLEARVRERTADLESFSYSVSHDLRAPLRAVDGYARMLEEDFGERLDAEGRRLLGVVRDSSARMGHLIDDLLAFSRLGRQEPARRNVDMDALVRDAIAEVRADSKAAIDTRPLPAAEADPAMLKQVWVNLIGNALKYSSKRAGARVEIGGCQKGAERVYWVRDNGAGFDMRYAQKLFGVFQRLHRADEFPGTGVGLALVQRVVTRHGGRVWAEGKPGEGACFHFSLP
jgi:signal transduction histidine kinase